MSYETIVVETRGRVGIIRLNRPQALNALNSALNAELARAIATFDADEGIGCVLLTGSEKAFAAGADIKELASSEGAHALIGAFWASRFNQDLRRHPLPFGADIKEMAGQSAIDMFMGDFAGAWHATANARKPVIAAVAGFALGGGCELALQCDLIIAADTAKFGQPEIKLGVIPGIGGTQRMTHAIGKAKAMDMILTGRMMDATEAERAGLATTLPLAATSSRIRAAKVSKPSSVGRSIAPRLPPRRLRRCRCPR